MFSVQNVSVNFSGQEVFNNINFLINPKDRIGLVGKNGAGKTSLLRLIVGELKPNEGQIVIPSDAQIGYLPQEMSFKDSHSILDEALKAFDEKRKIVAELERLNTYFSEATDYESDEYTKNLNLHHHLLERSEILNLGSMEGEAEKVLMGLGFLRSEFQNPTSSLSGGWRMRVELAKIILKKPELLLLDEPTNHLDIESIQWLEGFLSNYPGALLIISHDRKFLDTVCNRTIEITQKRIRDYKFPYSKYLEVRSMELEQNRAEYENQQKQIKEIEAFIERFRYKATKAKQVQSRIKMLERMELIELESVDKSSMHFRFPPAPPSGKVSLEIENLSKSYGDKTVISNVNLVVLKNEFVAFVGKNGEGKSTLVKSIVNEIDYEGKIKLGHQIEIGYYGQNQADMLDLNKSVFETIDDAAVGDIRKNIRGLLGSFLFSDKDLDKRVKVLSGGEKARLSLAKMLLKPVNLLILDEPTNHLDMQSKDILKYALQQFNGSLILVSHDREFLTGLSQKTYEFKGGKVIEHLGDIDFFLEKRAMESLKEMEMNQKLQKQQNETSKSSNKDQYLQKKELEKQKRKLERKVEKIESEISTLEEKIALQDEKIKDPEKYGIDFSDPTFYQEYEADKRKLDQLIQDWENTQMELES